MHYIACITTWSRHTTVYDTEHLWVLPLIRFLLKHLTLFRLNRTGHTALWRRRQPLSYDSSSCYIEFLYVPMWHSAVGAAVVAVDDQQFSLLVLLVQTIVTGSANVTAFLNCSRTTLYQQRNVHFLACTVQSPNRLKIKHRRNRDRAHNWVLSNLKS